MYYYLLQPLLRYYDVTDRSPHNKMALIVTLIYLYEKPFDFLAQTCPHSTVQKPCSFQVLVPRSQELLHAIGFKVGFMILGSGSIT